MKAHIVFAHPNLASFNGQLKVTATETLKSLGWTVTTIDLYQVKFKASADEGDFEQIEHSDFFDLQMEQQAASQNQSFSSDIIQEQKHLSEADLIIFQFPLWWYSMPALLKGYIDRVFSYGWAYGGHQALAGKKLLVCMTTGAPEFAWTDDKRGTIQDNFKHLFIGTFGLCGILPLEPFIVYGAKRLSDEEKKGVFFRYQKTLQELTR
jgi:NAD(P)H dehydrogenase (quinone)